MSRLIVLSNRVKMPDNNPMAGGLAVALQDVLIANSGIWMGWNGDILDRNIIDTFINIPTCTNNDHGSHFNDSVTDKAWGNINEFTSREDTSFANADFKGSDSKINYMTTALTSSQYQQYYCGFANSVLWPMLHEQIDLISQAPEDYTGYQTVNRLFARQLKKVIKPDDVIWIHDYHFLSVAYYCRQLGMNNRIGFFLHIPFAPLAFWHQLDKSPELIRHLAHYDILGTQTQKDKANCLAVIQHYLKSCLLESSLHKDNFANNSLIADNSLKDIPNTKHAQSLAKSNGATAVKLMLNLDLGAPHYLSVDAYPIGVNVEKIQQQVANLSKQPSLHLQSKKTLNPVAQQIIAVDRIDYSKGLLEKFAAYRKFLQHYPIFQNQLDFLQIACPSRLDLPVYQRLRESVRLTVNEVNQQFLPSDIKTDILETENLKVKDFKANTDNWQAITYSECVLNHEALMKAFWHSDIGWVNSLKDGMNLVAKEYIAAQNPNNPGVLVLSRYAGASEQMQAAVIIDPYRPKSIIEGLYTALNMPLAERKNRYHTLLKGLQENDLHHWHQDFLNDLYAR